MSRFRFGQAVSISGFIATRHRDRKGTVVQIQVSRYSRPDMTSLDKYTIRFPDGDEGEFYDIQLDPPPESGTVA